MKQVEFNTKSENPFYGMSNTLTVFQNASKGASTPQSLLQAAWDECKDLNQKAVLISILFSVGDVTARQHNLFESKVETGGNSERVLFRDTIIPFLNSVVKGAKNRQKLMFLITEYTTMDNILANRVVTKKKTPKYLRTINMIDVFGIENVATYCANIIQKGTDFQKICLSKFLTRPRFSKRPGKTQMLPETRMVMARRIELLRLISKKASLLIEEKGTYTNFTGFYKWKAEYNGNLESVMFSSGKINSLDKEEFIKWMQELPADARFRVKNRVKYGEAWAKFSGWYDEWEKFKEIAQTKQRELETKVQEGQATETDVELLKEVKRQARVNVGAVNFAGMFTDIVNGSVDTVKVQPFLDKVNLPYNTLTFIDDSGSMKSMRGNGFTARQFGAFMATICLSKNPDADAKNVIGLFSNTCRMYNGITSISVSQNSLLTQQTQKIAAKPLINTNDHFLTNLNRMSKWLDAASTWNGTNMESVINSISSWANSNEANMEELRKYPVWTFISDGNFNNKRSVEASVNSFMRQSENNLGFKPFIILIDVAGKSSADVTRFEGIDNLMMIPPNPAQIEMFLTNFRDMDVYDVYTPLQSVYRSKRYAPIRNFIYDTESIVSAKKKVVVS